MISFPEMLAASATLTCARIDARTGLIPNRITYPTLAILLMSETFAGTLWVSIWGTICVSGSLLFLYCITRKRGLGLGDVKLGACIGAGLGPFAGMRALASSFIFGGAVGLYLLLSGKAKRTDSLRFGPFLALGTIVALAEEMLG